MKFTSPIGGIQQADAPERAAKSGTLFLLSDSDYKRLDISLYFIITNFHSDPKPQVKVSYGMNSPAFTLHNV